MALTLYLAMTRNNVNVWALSLEDVEAMTTTSILSLNVRWDAASQVIIMSQVKIARQVIITIQVILMSQLIITNNRDTFIAVQYIYYSVLRFTESEYRYVVHGHTNIFRSGPSWKYRCGEMVMGLSDR